MRDYNPNEVREDYELREVHNKNRTSKLFITKLRKRRQSNSREELFDSWHQASFVRWPVKQSIELIRDLIR